MLNKLPSDHGDDSAKFWRKFSWKMVGEKKLNPMANEWNPKHDISTVDERCLFLTFSNGYPLDENQIFEFFTWKYGACVETVYVHWPNPKHRRGWTTPMFGKVVFTTSAVPVAVLEGESEKKFKVGGKQMRCKPWRIQKC